MPPASELLSLEQAIRCATINGAYTLFLEKEVGSIEVAKYADMVIFQDDIFTLAPTDLADIVPKMTIEGGEIVYFAE